MTSPLPAAVSVPGACDCHIHIYDPAYALAATATFTPPPAALEDYRKVQQALGLSRAVIVQPTGYGFDNRCTLAALAGLGPDGRGVAVVDASVDEETAFWSTTRSNFMGSIEGYINHDTVRG